MSVITLHRNPTRLNPPAKAVHHRGNGHFQTGTSQNGKQQKQAKESKPPKQYFKRLLQKMASSKPVKWTAIALASIPVAYGGMYVMALQESNAFDFNQTDTQISVNRTLKAGAVIKERDTFAAEFGAVPESDVKYYLKAENLLREAIVRDPNYDDPYIALAGVMERQNRFDEAIAYHREAVRLGNPDHLLEIAADYRALGKIPESIAVLEQATKSEPEVAYNAWSDLGEIYRVQKDFNKAGQCWENAIELSSGMALIDLGQEPFIKLAKNHFYFRNDPAAALKTLGSLGTLIGSEGCMLAGEIHQTLAQSGRGSANDYLTAAEFYGRAIRDSSGNASVYEANAPEGSNFKFGVLQVKDGTGRKVATVPLGEHGAPLGGYIRALGSRLYCLGRFISLSRPGSPAWRDAMKIAMPDRYALEACLKISPEKNNLERDVLEIFKRVVQNQPWQPALASN